MVFSGVVNTLTLGLSTFSAPPASHHPVSTYSIYWLVEAVCRPAKLTDMKKGLAVGISNYEEYGELKGCIEDAKAVADILKWNGPPENGDVNFEMEIKPDLKRAELRGAIKTHFAKDADVLLFYFSGHGELDDAGGYLLTADAVEDDPGVPMDFIMTHANNSPARNKIIILDCCHSGAFGQSNYKAAVAAAEIHRGITILTASNDKEVAFQVDERGAFTGFLLRALEGDAADLTGYITPGSVYAYIDKMLGLADEQRPVFKTNVSSFTVLRKIAPVVPWSVMRNIIKYFPEPDHKYKLDPSYEFTNTKGADNAIEPYAKPENVTILQELQKLQSIGLVVPHNARFMYFAAMDKKACKLTPLGQQYWAIINRKENN